MAKLKKGILGPISGKLGPVTGGTWKGIPYLRESTDPAKLKDRSAAQIANQEKFKFGNEWLVPFHPYISVGYMPLATVRTAISAAFSANYNSVISGTWPDLVFNYSKLLISKGNLPVLQNLEVALIADDRLEFTWQNIPHKHASYNDQLIVVAYSHELGVADGVIGSALRRDQQYTFKFTDILKGRALEIYVGLISMNRKKAADSVYLGRIEP